MKETLKRREMKPVILLNCCISVANNGPLERKTLIKIDIDRQNRTEHITVILLEFSIDVELKVHFLNFCTRFLEFLNVYFSIIYHFYFYLIRSLYSAASSIYLQYS